MTGVVKALVVGVKCRAHVTPIGALGEIDDEVEVAMLPLIVNKLVLVLGLHRFYLEAVSLGTIGDDEVDAVCCIKERGENLPTGLHEPSGDEEFEGMVLVEPFVCISKAGGAPRHGLSVFSVCCRVNVKCEAQGKQASHFIVNCGLQLPAAV